MKQDFKKIAEDYRKERETCSLNYFVLDPYIIDLLKRLPKGKCLDFGSGIGTVSKYAANEGFDVTSYEPDEAMFAIMENHLRGKNIQMLSSQCDITDTYSLILSMNMIDYVDDVSEMLTYYNNILDSGGHLVLSVPHPLKDLGDWEKRKINNKWEYLYYRLDGYMTECVCDKNRENSSGDVINSRVRSYHRKISTYYNELVRAGFSVLEIQEPYPAPNASKYPAIFEKSSRIPYFLIFHCKKEKRI